MGERCYRSLINTLLNQRRLELQTKIRDLTVESFPKEILTIKNQRLILPNHLEV